MISNENEKILKTCSICRQNISQEKFPSNRYRCKSCDLLKCPDKKVENLEKVVNLLKDEMKLKPKKDKKIYAPPISDPQLLNIFNSICKVFQIEKNRIKI